MSDQSVKRWKPSQCAIFASGDMEFIEVSEYDRIVAELDELRDSLSEYDIATLTQTIAKQKRVIDKIKAALDNHSLYPGAVCIAIRDAIERGEK